MLLNKKILIVCKTAYKNYSRNNGNPAKIKICLINRVHDIQNNSHNLAFYR